MGAQRIFQAARLKVGLVACACVVLASSLAAAAPRAHERVAVVDLGPDAHDSTVRQRIAAAIVAAGLDPVIGDGVEDALAGQNVDKDAVELAAALGEAQRAFGALDCAVTITASTKAAAIGAMRQAAGLDVPELARAFTYLLLCKDRGGDTDGAMVAATRLRALGMSIARPGDVPPAIWRKYPEVDTVIDRELVRLEIATDIADADVWIDLAPAGKAPLQVQLPAGDHLIAVARGTRRGWAAGHTDPAQTKVVIPTTDRATASSAVASRVASWKGALPAPAELGWVMGEVRARIVLVRRGDTVEAWGRIGRSEMPYRLGGDDGIAKLGELDRLLALVVDRVQTWNDRAPDPDRPLLVETPGDGGPRRREDPPTKWWVYAAIGAAAVAAGTAIYLHDAGNDRQRVELIFPRVQP